jgi:hypothetical protein
MSDAVSARSTDLTAANKSTAITVLAEPESIPQGERKTVTSASRSTFTKSWELAHYTAISISPPDAG